MEKQETLEQIKLIRNIKQKALLKILFSPWQWMELGYCRQRKTESKK